MPFDQSPDLRPFVRTDEQRANLLKLADAVMANERFRMSSYTHPCGSPACIMGSGMALGFWPKSRDSMGFPVPMYFQSEALGLTFDEGYRLSATNAPWQTAPAAAAELRRLADERVP